MVKPLIEFVAAFSYWNRVIRNFMRTATRFEVVAKRVNHLFAFCKLPPRCRIVERLIIDFHGERLGFWHPMAFWRFLVYCWHSANIGNNVAKFKIYALITKTPPFLCSGVIIVNVEPAFPRWVILFDAMTVPDF